MINRSAKEKIEEEHFRQQLTTSSKTQRKQKHGVPAIPSLFFPGLGQLVKGQDGKGIIIFLAMFPLSITIIGAAILWIWQIADAYYTNPQINRI